MLLSRVPRIITSVWLSSGSDQMVYVRSGTRMQDIFKPDEEVVIVPAALVRIVVEIADDRVKHGARGKGDGGGGSGRYNRTYSRHNRS